MNTKCEADIFRIDDRVFLRCFKDGTLIEIKDKVITECPHCKRPLDICHDYPNSKTRVVLQVWDPALKDWVVVDFVSKYIT